MTSALVDLLTNSKTTSALLSSALSAPTAAAASASSSSSSSSSSPFSTMSTKPIFTMAAKAKDTDEVDGKCRNTKPLPVDEAMNWVCPLHTHANAPWEQIAYLFLIRVLMHTSSTTADKLSGLTLCGLKLMSFSALMSHYHVDEILALRCVMSADGVPKKLSSAACKHRFMRFTLLPDTLSISVDCDACMAHDCIIDALASRPLLPRGRELPPLALMIDGKIRHQTYAVCQYATVVCSCNVFYKRAREYNASIWKHALDDVKRDKTFGFFRDYDIQTALATAKKQLIPISTISEQTLAMVCALMSPFIINEHNGTFAIASHVSHKVTESPIGKAFSGRLAARQQAAKDGDDDSRFDFMEDGGVTAFLRAETSRFQTYSEVIMTQLVDVSLRVPEAEALVWWSYSAFRSDGAKSEQKQENRTRICLACCTSHSATAATGKICKQADTCLIFDLQNTELFAACTHDTKYGFCFRSLQLAEPSNLSVKTAFLKCYELATNIDH